MQEWTQELFDPVTYHFKRQEDWEGSGVQWNENENGRTWLVRQKSWQQAKHSKLFQSMIENLKQNEAQSARAESTHKDVPLVQFMYLVFTRMPGECHRMRLSSLLLYWCYVFRVLINSLGVCWQCMNSFPFVRLHTSNSGKLLSWGISWQMLLLFSSPLPVSSVDLITAILC